MQGQACQPLKSELIVFNNVRFKNSFLMLVLWQAFLRQGRWSAFGPPGLGGLAPEHWPNPLSLSRPTDTRQPHDVMAQRLHSLMAPKSLLLWLSWGLGAGRGPCCGAVCCYPSAVCGAVFDFRSRAPPARAFKSGSTGACSCVYMRMLRMVGKKGREI